MTDLTIREVPLSPELEGAFRVPTNLEGTELGDLHAEMTTQLRREAAGIEMTTNQLLLIERIVTTYVTIKDREENDTWRGVSQQKEMNTYLLDLQKEFSKLLQANQEAQKRALLDQVLQVVMDGLELVEDNDVHQKVTNYLTRRFGELGL